MNYFFVKTTWVHVYPCLCVATPLFVMKKMILTFYLLTNWFKAIKIQTNKKKKNPTTTHIVCDYMPAFLSSNDGWLKQNHYFNIFRCWWI